MLLGTLSGKWLGNMLSGKGANRAGDGINRAGDGKIRAGYGFKGFSKNKNF